MKFIHCADIHFSSAMDTKMPAEKAEERKKELQETFRRMLEYAKSRDIKAVLLCGDIFDKDRPSKADKQFFYDAINLNQDIDFFYLKGNHDNKTSYTEEIPENLKCFTGDWTTYEYTEGNRKITVSGIETDETDEEKLYSLDKLEEDNVNIVMLHGQISDGAAPDRIDKKRFAYKKIDYLALGHVHKFSEGTVDGRCRWCYSGCLEGRGFDETGSKGFVIVDTSAGPGNIDYTFVPFAKRTILDREIDISEIKNTFELPAFVEKSAAINKNDILRIVLKGERNFTEGGYDKIVRNALEDKCYFVYVKDKTVKNYRAEDYEKSLSLRGEFIRKVKESDKLTDEEKNKVITYGLRALDGEELE